MKCCVAKCPNTNSNRLAAENGYSAKWRFFRFPKDEKLVKLWKEFCRRGENFNIKTAAVCSAHFRSEDFERNLQYEMGFCSRNPTKLKPTAYPTVLAVPSESSKQNERHQNVEENKTNNELCALLNRRQTIIESILAYNEKMKSNAKPVVQPVDENIILGYLNNLKEEIEVLKDEAKTKNVELKALKLAEKTHLLQINGLKAALQKSEFYRNNLEQKLRNFFTEGQIKTLRNYPKRHLWNEEDMRRATILYATSKRAYKLLLKNGFPLPGIRTLQQWEQKKTQPAK